MKPMYKKSPKKYDTGGQVDEDSGADDKNSFAYKVQHAFDPPEGTQHDVKDQKFLNTDNGYSAGGEVTESEVNDSDDDPNAAKHIPTSFDTEAPAADSDLRIKTEMDAEGGEVGRNDDDELDDAMGSEFCDAIHAKDKKGIMSSLQAIASSLKNRSK